MADKMTSALMELNLDWPRLCWAFGLFVVASFGSIVPVLIVLVRLPCTHFQSDQPCPDPSGCGIAGRYWLLKVLKNLLGVVLVGIGIILSLPGIPGQGLLTILVGLLLIDIPGKHRLEKKLVARPAILRSINRVRSYFGKPPLIVDE
jgi:hypothetical protein